MRQEENGKLEYNVQQRARAGTAATFRAVVALYIGWLGVRLIRGAMTEASTLPVWAAWLVGVVFIAAAVGFGCYIWNRWKLDVEAARIAEPEPDDEADCLIETEPNEEDAPDP